jgi:DNA-binding HxlR family transcriptional regulator
MPPVPPRKRHPYDQWSPDARALDLVGDKWTLLIVRDLAAGPRRFVELQRLLPGISTEQLRSRLNRMVADEMLTRRRFREVPPRVEYELTDRARELMPVLGELARWAYEWAWGPPRESEKVDLGAIFRLAPGLMPLDDTWGTVEFSVRDAQGALSYCCTVGPRGATVQEGEGQNPDARVIGSPADWVRALSPDRDRRGLEISGNRDLAEKLLEYLMADSHAAERREPPETAPRVPRSTEVHASTQSDGDAAAPQSGRRSSVNSPR